MKAQEVRDVIVNHVIPNFDEESLFGSYVVDALNMAINAVGAIDQIRWERDMAIKQLHDLGYGLGEKPREELNNSSQEVKKSNWIYRQATKHLDLFTKTYCRDNSIIDELVFRCSECEFAMPDETCLVKRMARKICPDYKGFGSMGDL